MTVGTYISPQQKDHRSKFGTVRVYLELISELVHRKVILKFNKSRDFTISSDLDLGHTSFEFKDESSLLDLKKTISPSLIFSDSIGALKGNWNKMMKRRIDWTRGRFNGKVQKITLNDGVILEKTFLTAKGSLIVVKRSEIGLLIRLFEA